MFRTPPFLSPSPEEPGAAPPGEADPATARMARTSQPPCAPVAPRTAMTSFSAMDILPLCFSL